MFSDFENMELIIIIGIQIVFYILTAFVKVKKRLKGNIRNVLLGVLQALVLYISILVIVKIIDIRLEQRLNSFDLDGDNSGTAKSDVRLDKRYGEKFCAVHGRLFSSYIHTRCDRNGIYHRFNN